MRCSGSPCAGSPLLDRCGGKEHYRLLTHYLKELVRFVEQGGRLEIHDDVPLSLRRQLYAEEQQRRNRKSGKVAESPGGPSPVTINILPSHARQATPPNGRAHSVGPVQVWDSSLADDLEIEGFMMLPCGNTPRQQTKT